MTVKSNNEVNHDRFVDAKQKPLTSAKTKRSGTNQRVRNINLDEFDTDEFAVFEKFHRSR